MEVGADLIFRSNPDYPSLSCKANSVSHPALLCQVTTDKQSVRAGTTLVLADFSAPVALLSWVMSSVAAMTVVYPGDRHTQQPYHWEASRPQCHPQLCHQIVCDLGWSLFIPMFHFTQLQTRLYSSSPLRMCDKCHIQERKKLLLLKCYILEDC